MARNGLPLLVCALLSALVPSVALTRPQESKSNQIDLLLQVDGALRRANEALRSREYQKAVNILEGELQNASGNKQFHQLLREAYRELIEDLRRNNRLDEIACYQRRLDIMVGEQPVKVGPTVAVLPPPPATASTTPAPALLPTAPAPATPVATAPLPTPVPMTSPTPAAATQPTAHATTGVTARGVPGEDPLDPFSEANSKQPELARKYLAKAEKEFAAGHYTIANSLYEQAFRADEKVLGEARARWAYCRLADVRTALQQPTPPPASELEKQVRQAMSLAPEATQLKKWGEDLLQVIEKRGKEMAATTTPNANADIPLRHTPRVQGSSWAIVDTTNFRVYHNLDPDVAAQAARAAETARSNGCRKWFGESDGAWNPRCDLYLYANGQDYATTTGQSAECPGHSSVGQSGERIHSRRIDIHVDAANWLTGVLPHETTHVVIAGRFGPQPVPRWADEGMAVLAEPRDLVQRHLRNLPQHRQDQQLFSLRELLTMDNYPKPRQVGAFYAQSVSLVDYLSRQPGGPQKFSLFLRDGLRSGYDASLKQHYGLSSLQELEGYWTRFAFQELATQPTTSGYAP